jgi:hypothetical protein
MGKLKKLGLLFLQLWSLCGAGIIAATEEDGAREKVRTMIY